MEDLCRRIGERDCRRDGNWRPGTPAATAAGTRLGGAEGGGDADEDERAEARSVLPRLYRLR
eukprot:scaffold22622_cov63-Phaeocystis_antarctica.AAC.3